MTHVTKTDLCEVETIGTPFRDKYRALQMPATEFCKPNNVLLHAASEYYNNLVVA